MKYLMLVPLLTGCWAGVSDVELEQLNTVCKNNGGFKSALMTITDGTNDIRCRDGAVFYLDDTPIGTNK